MLKRLLLFIFIVITSLQVYSQENDYFLHTIERGQTVYSIALTYNVSIESIYNINPGSREGIKTGEVLKIPQKKKDSTIYHTIQPKETLYSVSKKYNTTGNKIIEMNPGLSTLTFAAGRTIRIPEGKSKQVEAPKETQIVDIQHKVEKGETLFSLSQKYKVYIDDILQRNENVRLNGLKKGQIIFIPTEVTKTSDKEKTLEDETNSLLNKQTIKKIDHINVALLLPFGTTGKNIENSQKGKIIEYYEGFLLAIEDLKKKGISINLFVYDTANGVREILQKPELKQANLIIGGTTEEQIKQISEFSHKEEIKYVIPFSSLTDVALTNPYVFQINTPQNYLYSKASLQFIKKYEKYRVIFINFSQDKNDKADFVSVLQTDLKQNNIRYETITYNGASITKDMKDELNGNEPTVFVPASGSRESLLKILAPLKTIITANSSVNVSLFGYPEWQTYSDCIKSLYPLNTSIYSVFYADTDSRIVKNFYNRYKQWYNKYPINSYPKYGLLGYDTGMYFLELINNYGILFESSLDKMQYNSLQMGFNFDRVSYWGGFINLNIYMVTFQPNNNILREES